jgi:hypothetical protein
MVVSALNIGSSHCARHLPFEQRHQREKCRLLETIACGSIASPQSGHFLRSVSISMAASLSRLKTGNKKNEASPT